MKPEPTLQIEIFRKAFAASKARNGDEGLTILEWCDALKKTRSSTDQQSVRDGVRDMLATGEIVLGKAPRIQMNGVSRLVPVYRMVAKRKAGRK